MGTRLSSKVIVLIDMCVMWSHLISVCVCMHVYVWMEDKKKHRLVNSLIREYYYPIIQAYYDLQWVGEIENAKDRPDRNNIDWHRSQ